MMKLLRFAVVAAFSCSAAISRAGDIEERAAELQAIPQKIQNGELYTRIATLESILKAGDATSSAIAIKAAFATKESELRNIALRYWFKRNDHFIVTRIIPKKALDANQIVVDRRKYMNDEGGDLLLYVSSRLSSSISIGDYKIENGSGRAFVGTQATGPFQIQGDTVTFDVAEALDAIHIFRCTYGPFRLDGNKLTGPFACNYAPPADSHAEFVLE